MDPRVDQIAPKSQREAERLSRLFSLLDRIRKDITRGSREGVKDKIKCLCGDKDLQPDEVRVATHIQGVRMLDRTCADCRKETEKYASVYCLGCKELLLKRPPAVLGNGFVFKPGGRYHVRDCPKCSEEHYERLVEIENKIKENPNLEERLRPYTEVRTIEEIKHENRIKDAR